MTMLDILNRALESIDENYHNFLLRYKAAAKIVYGFVEGKDDPSLYKSAIDSRIPSDWQVDLLRAGNKDRVIRTYNSFDWSRFPAKRIAFFVDRDLDEFVGTPVPNAQNIYITDSYSIENIVVDEDVYMRMISEIGNITECELSEEATLRENFRTDFNFFVNSMISVMGQILVWRSLSARVNLTNIDLRPIYSFKDGRIYHQEGFDDDAARIQHCATCLSIPASPKLEVDKACERLRRHAVHWHGLIRGKYVMWFFAQYFNSVHQNINLFCKGHQKQPKMRFAVGAGNMMLIAGPRTRAPQSLAEFIQNNFRSYIGDQGQGTPSVL